MRLERRYELQKKRLLKAQEKISELEETIAENKQNEIAVQKLKKELEKTLAAQKSKLDEQQKVIDELKDKRAEYDILIAQLKILRKKMK